MLRNPDRDIFFRLIREEYNEEIYAGLPQILLFHLYYYNTKMSKRKIFLKILCINLPHPLLLYGGDRMTKINYPQRLAVSLTQEQYDKLLYLSEEKSVSMANLVRAAV